jgi:ribosomal protein S26
MTGMSAPYRTVDPYTDLDVIDTRGPRTNQAVVAIGTLLAYLLQQEWIVALLALQMIVGLTLGRRYCLPCRLWFDVLQQRIGEGPIEDARLPRFANLLAAVFLSLATALLYAGFGTAGWVITLMITALATLASVLNFCVGCEMYMLLARVRGVAIDRHPAR